MHKAIAMLQFKIEYEIIKRHPEFEMEERLLLHKINFDKGTITINNIEYNLKDKYFPTIDPKDPYKLTEEEPPPWPPACADRSGRGTGGVRLLRPWHADLRQVGADRS